MKKGSYNNYLNELIACLNFSIYMKFCHFIAAIFPQTFPACINLKHFVRLYIMSNGKPQIQLILYEKNVPRQ